MKRRYALLLMMTVLVALAGCGGGVSSGDRVLVSKFAYDSGLANPERYQVVVFKYPDEPLKKQVPTNYIKRLMGLPGELLAIFFGRIYRCDDEPSRELRHRLIETARREAPSPFDLRKGSYMYRDDPDAVTLFEQGKFQILRKPPATMLTMRRLIYDNDHQPKDLQGVLPPRWVADNAAWKADGPTSFRVAGAGGPDIAWLRYQHILRPEDWDGRPRKTLDPVFLKPQLIRDFSGYNSYETGGRPHAGRSNNWVGDLMLECEVVVDRAEGELWMQLARGVDRFQARWNLQTGDCTLFRLGERDKAGRQELATAKTAVKQAGTYLLRFANFDDRLTVWVDRELPFGDGVRYDAARQPGPIANDLTPALIGSNRAAAKVNHLKLWRDTYYTTGRDVGAPDAEGVHDSADFWSDPSRWQALRSLKPLTLFVQPGHYLCLGDNSPESADSRSWGQDRNGGTVPERLLLGRALVVYWPFTRLGTIK